MAPRIVSLMISAWIGMSAFALPRTAMQVTAFASMGLCCVVAELLAFLFGPARLANSVNAIALLLAAVTLPSPSAATVQIDIIGSGLLLILSSIKSRPLRSSANV